MAQTALANNSCHSVFSDTAKSGIAYYLQDEAPLLNARQVIEVYGIKTSQASQFIARYEREVINDYTWAQAGNPRLSGSQASLVVDMYRLQDHDMSREEINNLLRERRSVPGKILFKHILFETVR